MKENYINVVFVVDASGSMGGSESDVVGGFNNIINEQKAIKNGKCTVSLYTFDSAVKQVYLGKDVNDIGKFNYRVGGMTAMNDGIGTAIDDIGKWLSAMDESERPSKTLMVIMTDGFENASKEYSLEKVQEMIKHQTEKYNWEFVYVGADVTKADTACDLGIRNTYFTSKLNHTKSWDALNKATTCYRISTPIEAEAKLRGSLNCSANALTEEYEQELGFAIKAKND